MNKRTLWVTALLVVLAVASAGAAEKPMKIEILLGGKDIPLGLEGTADWTLTNTVKRLAVERTGVDAEWSRLADATIGTMVQMRMLAGNVPHVLDAWWLHMDAEGALAVRENDLAWEITPALVRKYLPKYTARLAKYGVTVEKLLATSRYLGRNIFLPTGLPFSAFPALAAHAGAKMPFADYYAVGFRDDVLKRIFPSARTEAELQELLVHKGSLDMNDIVGDIPIRSLEDFYRYLKAVKALNLKVGAKPLIPGAITASSQYMKSIDWSLRTIIGYFWDWSIIRGDPPDWERSTLIEFTPEYKEYWRWWNRLYNEGLLDPEMFVMKDDQFRAKQVNGEYAVINRWGPIEDARRVGKERGYGFRYFPVFYGQGKDIWGNYAMGISTWGRPLIFTKRIKEAELPRVLGWADWYLSEERDLLAYWGLPEWYTGTGANRRYKPAYAQLADWAVYGIASNRDGNYWGLDRTAAFRVDGQIGRLPISLVSFFDPALTYPEAPFYVYPKDPRKVLATTDLWTYCEQVQRAARYDEYRIIYTDTGVLDTLQALPELLTFGEAMMNDAGLIEKAAMSALTGPAADFDRAYGEVLALNEKWGAVPLRDAVVAWMRAHYETDIVPNIVVDKTRK